MFDVHWGELRVGVALQAQTAAYVGKSRDVDFLNPTVGHNTSHDFVWLNVKVDCSVYQLMSMFVGAGGHDLSEHELQRVPPKPHMLIS